MAKKFLIAVSKEKQPVIIHSRRTGGVGFQVGEKSVLTSPEPREVAKVDRSINGTAANLGYVETSGRGEVYRITDLGYERAEKLIAEDPILSLPDESKQILKTASKSSDGNVHFIPFDGGFQIMSGGRQFIEGNNPRDAANWKHGLERLIEIGLLEQSQYESIVQVSKKGYEVAEELFGPFATGEGRWNRLIGMENGS